MAKHSPSVQTRSSSNLSLLSCWNSSIVASLASLVQPACQRSTLGEPTMMGPKSWNFATKCIARSITHTIIILSLPTFLSAKRGWSSSKYKLFTVSCQIYFLFFFFFTPSPLSHSIKQNKVFDNHRTLGKREIDVQRWTTTWQSFHVKSKLESSWERPADSTITSQRHCTTTWTLMNHVSRSILADALSILPNFALS